MSQKTDIELRKAALLKAARAAIRLKHSIAADEELNQRLPRLERDFEAYVNKGYLPEVSSLLKDVLTVEEE